MFFLGATANIFAYLLASTFFIACFYCNVTVTHRKIIQDIPPVREIYADTQECFKTDSATYFYDNVINHENTPCMKKRLISSDDFRGIYINSLYATAPPVGNTLRAPPYF